MKEYVLFPEQWGNVTVKVDFSFAAFGAWALHDFWTQIAIAALMRRHARFVASLSDFADDEAEASGV